LSNKQLIKTKTNCYHTALILEEFKLPIYLGVEVWERTKKQIVSLSLKISFLVPPLGCQTGRISDTVCYYNLTKSIKKFIRGKKFTLIESLGMELFTLLKSTLPRSCKLYLALAKKPPITGLKQSIFEISD